MAPPTTSARSVAIATASACSQYANRDLRPSRWPTSSGSENPVATPSLADRNWTTPAAAIAITSTQTSR